MVDSTNTSIIDPIFCKTLGESGSNFVSIVINQAETFIISLGNIKSATTMDISFIVFSYSTYAIIG